jgi:hypothetical protein
LSNIHHWPLHHLAWAVDACNGLSRTTERGRTPNSKADSSSYDSASRFTAHTAWNQQKLSVLNRQQSQYRAGTTFTPYDCVVSTCFDILSAERTRNRETRSSIRTRVSVCLFLCLDRVSFPCTRIWLSRHPCPYRLSASGPTSCSSWHQNVLQCAHSSSLP